MKKLSYSMVMTTTSSDEETEKIALALIKEKLAACVQVLPNASHF